MKHHLHQCIITGNHNHEKNTHAYALQAALHPTPALHYTLYVNKSSLMNA